MEQPKDHRVDDRTNSNGGVFQGSSSSTTVELPANVCSSDGSEQSESSKAAVEPGKTTTKSTYPRRNPTNRQGNMHRRFKSLPIYAAGAPLPSVPVGCTTHYPQQNPNTRQTLMMGQEKNDAQHQQQYHHQQQQQQYPLYHPWVSGYDMQWSAYGMYVLSTVMSKRSEKPTRIIFIGNLAPTVEEKRVIEAAAKYGPIRGIDASLRDYWFGMFVSYWDTRHAEEALCGLPDRLPGVGSDEIQRIPVNVCFMLPPAIPGMENQGQITVKIEDAVTSTELRKLCGNFGEVKSVRTLTEDSKTVEFFDARSAETAVHELNTTTTYNHMIKEADFTKLTNVDVPPAYNSSTGAGGSVEETANSENIIGSSSQPMNGGDVSSPVALSSPTGSGGGGGSMTTGGGWTTPTTPYGTTPWTQFSLPHSMGHHPQNYSNPAVAAAAAAGVSEHRTLQRQHSAPAASYADHHVHHNGAPPPPPPPHPNVYPMRRPDAVWGGHYHLGYPPHGLQPWPYGNNHHPHHQPQPVPMVPISSRYDGVGNHLHRMDSHPGSPGYESHTSDGHSWRPHRTRSAGERVYDPAQFQFNLAEANSDPSAARTTLMIRNIPNKYSQKMLLDVLNKRYSGRFDFFYLPIDFKNRCNLGYAFVNFVDAPTTVEFYKEFHTKSWEEFNSKKVCEITYARVQGRDCLIEHFRNSRFPCNDPDYLPLVFEIESEGKKPGSKGTPVHHSSTATTATSATATTTDYTENTHPAVAAH